MPRIETRAFAVSDLFVTLTLLAILASIALPAVSRSVRRYAAHGAARELRADLARARIRAILDGRTVSLVVEDRGYRVERSDGTVLSRRTLPTGVTISTTAHRSTIPFTSRGTSNLYSTTTVAVEDDPDARTYVVRVSPSGAWWEP